MNQENKTPIQIIKDHLDARAQADPQFAVSYAKKNKSLNECFAFIIQEARKRASANVCCMSDDEVFGLAVHYYDEDSIKLSASEVKGAAKTAKVKASSGAPAKPKAKKTTKPVTTAQNTGTEQKTQKQIIQLELFNFDD